MTSTVRALLRPPLSISNSLSGGDWELHKVAAMRDPTHPVQMGGGSNVRPPANVSGVRPSKEAWQRAAL